MEGVVIIGAGHTGVQAAKTLRQEGWRGAITLIGAETEPPYQRPPLSKEILTGVKTLSDCGLFEPSFLARREIDLRAGARAVAIDRKKQEVRLERREQRPLWSPPVGDRSRTAAADRAGGRPQRHPVSAFRCGCERAGGHHPKAPAG